MSKSIEKQHQNTFRTRLVSAIPAPLLRAKFRQLWLGMASSYAGDRFQGLAQAWLVATLTSSALAVGWITTLGSIPLLFMPLGGVIADLVDRRRLLITWQIVGAIATAIVAVLVLGDRIAVWHIYVWSIINGLIALLSRPAYKVVLTEVVPSEEVRPAVAINSMTETTTMVVVNGVGSLVLEMLGLTLAFILNAATYLVAAGCLWGLRDLSRQTRDQLQAFDFRRMLSDLSDGLRYLSMQPPILHPLLLTFFTILVVGPTIGLLAAIVHAEDGSIVDLGLLAASTSLGAFVGAGFAGARSAGPSPTRRYAIIGLVTSVAATLFALLPVGIFSMVPLGVLGAGAFSQAVWNTSRIRELAEPVYQARLQAITSMAFTLGFSLGMLWAGIAIDRFGLMALSGGTFFLAALSIIVLLIVKDEKDPLGVRSDTLNQPPK